MNLTLRSARAFAILTTSAGVAGLFGTGSLFAATPATPPTTGSVTVVGNGDDGSDLEGATPVTTGKLVESRGRAASLVEHLNAQNIPGLGLLLAELKGASLYRAQGDQASSLPEDQGAFHANLRGQVYARTFARPHAPTRFFPIAEKLDEDQLVALQVHEALHRSLPESVREDEGVVAKITMAITAPDATYDQVRSAVDSSVPERDRRNGGLGGANAIASGEGTGPLTRAEANPLPEDAGIRNPSLLGYSYRHFQAPAAQSAFPVESMQTLQGYLYPFGSERVPLGIGMAASFVGLPDDSEMGPLEISARLRLWTRRGFDVGVFASAALNMLSNEELKHSPLGRDVYSLGLTAARDFKDAYLGGSLGYSAPGSTDQPVGAITYTHSYGSIIEAALRGGAQYESLRAGLFAAVDLATDHKVEGGAFKYDSGRFRIVSAGPEVGWYTAHYSVSGKGRFILSAPHDENFDDLGNLLGTGVAQGSLEATVAYYF